MVTCFSPHRQGGPTPVDGAPPFTPFKRSNSGLSSMEVPRHTPSPIPQTRASTRRQGTLVRTRSSPTRVALEVSSTNNLNFSPPSPDAQPVDAKQLMAEPFKTRQLRGRGIENTPAVSSPLKRREATTTSEAGDLASPRVKRRSQDGINRSSSRSSSPAGSSSDSSSTSRSKVSRTSLFSSAGKAISHTPKKPTGLKKVVNTHHFEKPKIARSRLQTTKPPVFSVSTPAPTKIKRITSFDDFVSPAHKEPEVPQTANVGLSKTPFAQIVSDTPFKKPFAAPFPRPTFTPAPQQTTFATPQISKPVQGHPPVFMSTGLLTKKNRPSNGNGTSFLPPETPCKKPTFMTRKPTMVSNAPPDTPFTHKGRGRLNFTRTESFQSIVDSGSPEGSQSNTQQEYLQTPTKRLHTSDSSGSLRGLNKKWKRDPSLSQESAAPQTPQASVSIIDLDASRLSISGKPSQPLFAVPSTPRSARDLFGNLRQTPENAKDDIDNSPDESFNTSGVEQTMTPVMDRTSKTFSKEWDPALESKFSKVTQIGAGEFSVVFEVEERLSASQPSTQLITPENSSENGSPPNAPNMMPRHYAVKRVQFHGQRDRDLRIEEVNVLKALGKHKNVVEYIDSWETALNLRVYIQTEFCELGGLDNFLCDYGNHGRLDPFRIWKIFTEISELPDNGPSWQKLRAGDLGEIPDLTPESLMHSCIRDDRGFPVVISDDSIGEINESFGPESSFVVSPASHLEGMLAKFINNPHFRARETQDLIEAPKFLEGDSLRYMINWLISPDPALRPSTSEILASSEVRWIRSHRRCSALVYEGEWGPAEPLSDFCEDMDISDMSGEIRLDVDGEDWVMME
ncbi:hypothetical protein ABW21_db0209000 [Orbilia brochopaga]|nr:hypothetical protein ABW21_db0209000 [Drechslerella brochopaga]